MEKSIEQLKLYPAETVFNIKAKNFETGDVKILKNQTIETYQKSLKYLKYLNAKGYNVFLSACKAGGVYILLDDISKATIERLYKDGFEPFYFLQTSPDNFQAVIKLSDSPLDYDIQTFVSKQLSELYNADPNSTDPGHFFRLAGFTNRKKKYCKNGYYPYVKLYAGIGKFCSKGQEYIDRISLGINNGLIELPERHIATPPIEMGRKETLETGCAAYVKKVYESNNLSDLSALDFKAARYALLKGFKATDIAKAILTFSPDIQTRKKGHIDDYISRTVKNASMML